MHRLISKFLGENGRKKILIATSLIALALPVFADRDDHGRNDHDRGRGGYDHGRDGRGGFGHHGPFPFPGRPNPYPYPYPRPQPQPYPYPQPQPYPQPYPPSNPYPQPYPPSNPYPGNGGYYTEYLQTILNQTVVGNQLLQVKQLFNLNYQKYGKSILQVKIQAKSLFGLGMAQLVVNDQFVGNTIQLSTNLQEISFQLPNYLNRNEIDVRQLGVKIMGAAYISTLGVVIEQ